MTTKTLILGGMSSGKSLYAEKLALSMSCPKIYLATATGNDEQMRAKIDRHIVRRDRSWRTIEEPYAIADVLRDVRLDGHVILVDCLTLWLSNIIEQNNVESERKKLCKAVQESNAHIIMVSNEIGLGGVPMNALARQFAEETGELHQALVEVCNNVTLVAAGLPLVLKSV